MGHPLVAMSLNSVLQSYWQHQTYWAHQDGKMSISVIILFKFSLASIYERELITVISTIELSWMISLRKENILCFWPASQRQFDRTKNMPV